MTSERLVQELLKNYDDESKESMMSIASLIDDMTEGEPCIVSNIYDTKITSNVQNNIHLSSFVNSSIIAQCTICVKEECKSCSNKETDCPFYKECNTIEEFMKKNGLNYQDIQLYIDKKIYPKNVDNQEFEEFIKTFPFDKNMYKVELVMTGASGFGKVALYTALNHLNSDKDGVVFLSVWKKNAEFLKKYYKKIGFEMYNEELGKMRVLSLKTLLSRLSTEDLPDSFIEVYNTSEPHQIYKSLLTSRKNTKRFKSS